MTATVNNANMTILQRIIKCRPAASLAIPRLIVHAIDSCNCPGKSCRQSSLHAERATYAAVELTAPDDIPKEAAMLLQAVTA